MSPITKVLILFSLFVSIGVTKNSLVFADEKKNDVLDFEADVIEGEKKAPYLFLQVDVESADLSSVLFDRANFNDFHVVQSKRRPMFSDPKRTKK